ncbi:MAG: alpha-galactosidase [Clostridia bacterium]|nr:alpha-galactosidase [Clostridia bacterium]
MTEKFFDIYYKSGDVPNFCYRSGMLVYEEKLYNGALISCGYNAAGYPLDVLSNFPSHLDRRNYTEPFAFNIEIDGRSIDYGLRFVDFKVDKAAHGVHSVLELESLLLPIRLYVHTLLDGTQMFTRYIEIENLSDKTVCLSRLSLISGALEDMDIDRLTSSRDVSSLYSYGCFTDDRWGREGEFEWRPLNTEVTCVDTRYNRDRFRHPVIFLKNNLMGKLWFAQIAWSGGCRFTFDYNAKAESASSHISFKAEILSHNPMYVINSGEMFTTPEVHVGLVHGGVDDAVNEMHAHTRKTVFGNEVASLLVGAGMGAEHDMSIETSKRFIDNLAEMGAEVFIVDAGWACPPGLETHWGDYNGINIANAQRYPNGLEEIADYCHAKGLKFGLWVDIDCMGKLAPEYDKNPDWRVKNIFGEQSGNFVDYSREDTVKWAEEQLVRIINDYKIDLLRIDCNVDYKDYFGIRDTGYGINECTSIRHFNAVYGIFQRLKARFPDVVFENCAGGGGRTDLGMMKAFNHTWVSDCQCAPHSVYITNGMTMALPPERVDRLFAGMGCHSFGSFDLHMRNTMLTHMSLNVISPAATQMNSQQLGFVKHSTDVYKNFIRPFLPTCKVYHHTPDTLSAEKNGFIVLEIAADDKSKGAIGVFSLPLAATNNCRVFVKGADASRNYKITLDNSGASYYVSGSNLMQNGIDISIASQMSSELVLYQAE